MNTSCILLAAVATLLSAATTCLTKDITPEKLSKSYEKLNKYLEQNVMSDGAKLNMGQVEYLLETKAQKCTLLGGLSLVETLRLLSDFASSVSITKAPCDRSRVTRMLEELDSGLVELHKSQGVNYKATRVDRMIELYAVRAARHCDFETYYPSTSYAFKQVAYDEIDRYLVDQLPETQEVAANLAKVEEWFKSSTPRDGALTRAMGQFLMLELMATEELCDEMGHSILLNNDLATRLRAHHRLDKPLRRVDKIFKQLAQSHANICRPHLKQKLVEKLENLDLDSYRKVLGMLSSYYMNESPGKRQRLQIMAKIINERSVSKDFSPVNVELDEHLFTKWDDRYRMRPIGGVTGRELFSFVEAASSEDPDHKYLGKLEAAKGTGIEILHDDKINELAKRYLIEPCENYLRAVGGIVEADLYSANQIEDYLTSAPEEYSNELSYHMVHAGFQYCKFVVQHPTDVFTALKGVANKHQIDYEYEVVG